MPTKTSGAFSHLISHIVFSHIRPRGDKNICFYKTPQFLLCWFADPELCRCTVVQVLGDQGHSAASYKYNADPQQRVSLRQWEASPTYVAEWNGQFTTLKSSFHHFWQQSYSGTVNSIQAFHLQRVFNIKTSTPQHQQFTCILYHLAIEMQQWHWASAPRRHTTGTLDSEYCFQSVGGLMGQKLGGEGSGPWGGEDGGRDCHWTLNAPPPSRGGKHGLP